MKVVCDNCGAMYKIPEAKLTKPVNKATCRQCGHKMLIPRPAPAIDPEERTVVSQGRPEAEEAPRKADLPGDLPSYDERPVHTTPIHEPEELTSPNAMDGEGDEEYTQWVATPFEGSQTPKAAPPPPSPSPPSSPPRPASGFSSRSRGAAPRGRGGFEEQATLISRDPTQTISPELEPEPAPPPPPAPAAPSPPPAPVAAQHDPAGDVGFAIMLLILAFLGLLGLLGSALLGMDPYSEGPYYIVSVTLLSLGSAFAFGGVLGSMVVLTSGGRGRKPALRFGGLALGVLAGFIVAVAAGGGRLGWDANNGAFDEGLAVMFGDSFAEQGLTPATNEPVTTTTLAAPEPVEGTDTDAPAGGESEEATAPPATAETPVTERPDRRGGSPSASRRSSASSREVSLDEFGTEEAPDEPVAEDELDLPDDLSDLDGGGPSAAPASSLPDKPNMQALDIMLKSNAGIKRCFFDYMKDEGSLPKKVEVRLKVLPSGDATSISAVQGKFQGTELESCLIRSIRAINFPPSKQGIGPITVPYTFK